MSGQPEFSVKDKIAQLDKLLDEYELTVGLPSFSSAGESEAVQYLNMGHEQLRKLTPDQCGEADVLLCSYALHVQRAYNRELTRAQKADSEIKKIVSREAQQYAAPSADERRNLAIVNNEVASKWLSVSEYARQRAERLAYVSSGIKSIANALNELQRTRRSTRI